MSKEFDLTTQAQKPYPENGDKYMPEPGNREVKPSKAPQEVKSPSVPKQEGRETVPTIEPNKDLLRKAWARSSGYESFEEIPYEERQTLDYLVEKGRAPISGGAELPPEEILRFVDTGEGLGFSREDLDDTLRAVGFSAEDISARSEEEKIEMLRSRVGAGSGEPPEEPRGGVLPEDEYSDTRLNSIAREIDLIISERGFESISPEHIEKQRDRIFSMLDAEGSTLPREEAEDLLGRLDNLKGRISRESEAKLQRVRSGKLEVDISSLRDGLLKDLFEEFNRIASSQSVTSNEIADIMAKIAGRRDQIQLERTGRNLEDIGDFISQEDQERADAQNALFRAGDAAEQDIINQAFLEMEQVKRSLLSNEARLRAGTVLAIEADKIMPSILENEKNGVLTDEEREKKENLRRRIIKELEDSPSVETGAFPSEILGATRYFREIRESLINEILFKSYEDKSETNHYEIDLYASSNLNVLLGYLSRDDKESYEYFLSLKTAANYFHSMNAGILAGNLENFSRIAEAIGYQHFERMREIKGVGLAMRLYEEKYNEMLAREKRITEPGYAFLKNDVERVFELMNEEGKIESQYAKEREDAGESNPGKMEPWEINRALGAGRTFFNITLRGGEKIATGQVPLDRKQYASFPQEDMVRILNWNEWFLKRFQVSSGKHGVEFLNMVLDRNREFLLFKGKKLGKNKIVEFGGVNVEKMENGGQYHTSGVYSGWRMENLAFDRILLRDSGDGESETIMQFMDRVKPRVARVKEKVADRLKANPGMRPADVVTKDFQEEYAAIFSDLVDRADIGLGLLIKNANIGGGDDPLGYILRENIWKKISSKNVPLMIDYLTDIKYHHDAKLYVEFSNKPISRAEIIKKLRKELGKKPSEEEIEKEIEKEENKIMENLKKDKGITKKVNERKELMGDAKNMERLLDEALSSTIPKWEDMTDVDHSDYKKIFLSSFRDIIQLDKESRIENDNKTLHARGVEVADLSSLDGNISEPLKEAMVKLLHARGVEVADLSSPNDIRPEKEAMVKLLELIRGEGSKLAPHLADISFPYMNFMNDVPFEVLDYSGPGQTFYKRRTGGDLGGFNKGQHAFIKIMDNPGGLSAEHMIEAVNEMIGGIAGPEGDTFAQEAVFSVIDAYLEMTMTEPGKRQLMINQLSQALRKHTSVAQEWAGHHGLSMTESEAAGLIDEGIIKGIISPDLAKYMKKKKHVSLLWLIWAIIRDIAPNIPVMVGASVVNAIKK